MNQAAFACNLLKVWEKLHVQGAIDFGRAFAWLKTGTRFFSQSPSIEISIA